MRGRDADMLNGAVRRVRSNRWLGSIRQPLESLLRANCLWLTTYVKRPDCFVWVAVFEPSPGELQEMQREFDLHELAVEDAHHGHQRPKIEEYGNSLFTVLQAIDMKGDEIHVGEVEIFVGPNYILSVRLRSERRFQSVRARCENKPHLLKHGATFVLYALMDAVVDRYFPVLDALESGLEQIEEQIFKRNTARFNIEALYGLKQEPTTLKHAVDPLMEATGKLYGGRVPQPMPWDAEILSQRLRSLAANPRHD